MVSILSRQGGGRHAILFFVRLIGRMHRRLDAEDDCTHQLHHRREQQLTRILLRRRVCEAGINPIGVQQALSHAPGHDTDGALLDEKGQYGVQQHLCHLQQLRLVLYEATMYKRQPDVERSGAKR